MSIRLRLPNALSFRKLRPRACGSTVLLPCAIRMALLQVKPSQAQAQAGHPLPWSASLGFGIRTQPAHATMQPSGPPVMNSILPGNINSNLAVKGQSLSENSPTRHSCPHAPLSVSPIPINPRRRVVIIVPPLGTNESAPQRSGRTTTTTWVSSPLFLRLSFSLTKSPLPPAAQGQAPLSGFPDAPG